MVVPLARGVMSIARLSGEELIPLLRAKSVTVVDVRDSDFSGGNIAGALHVPKDEFKFSVEKYVDQLKNKEHVVFHCMMSQVRGPYCAKLFHRELVKANVEPLPKVSILDGGFEDFVVQHHHEKDLFEDLNERKWGFNTN